MKILYYYGIRGVTLKWFESYLENTTQFVQINKDKSNTEKLRCGVPQGSFLGPLLFIIYVNDMCNISDKLKFILFADDTSVFMSHSDVQVLQNVFKQEILKISNWFLYNKLVLNYDKTKFMVFYK